jgi:hypothetical protein
MIRVFLPALSSEHAKLLTTSKGILTRLPKLPYVGDPVGVTAIPSLIDLMGFSGGGGLPGIVVVVGDVRLRHGYFLSIAPGVDPFKLMGGLACFPVGVTTCAGTLLATYEVPYGNDFEDVKSGTELPNGVIMFDAVEYKPVALSQVANANP